MRRYTRLDFITGNWRTLLFIAVCWLLFAKVASNLNTILKLVILVFLALLFSTFFGFDLGAWVTSLAG